MDAGADRAPLQSALRKARWRILPLLAAGYLAAYTDRANISFAAESMNHDLHFTPSVYGLGAGIFFVSYALCEIPSNGLLLRFGARRWLARIMLTWGVLAAAMMFVHGRPSFYGMRLLLGAAEAGYFPGVLYFLSQWFPCGQRARAISWFYVAFPLSNTVMGLAAGSLLQLDGTLGLRGWQWLFVIEGLPAILLSVAFWLWLPESPSKASWLDDAERTDLNAALAAETNTQDDRHGWELLQSVLRERRVWVLGLYNFCLLVSSYGISFFLPTIVRELTGLTLARTGYLIALSGVLSAVAMLVNASHSDRALERRWHVLTPTLLMAAIMLVAGLHLRGAVVGVMLSMQLVVYTSMFGPLNVLATELCRGRAAALALATYNTCGIFGGFVGPYWMGWVRELTGGYALGIGSLCMVWLVAAGCILWLTTPRVANVTKVGEKTMNATPELADEG
jgi:MFS transporter, ACS family, tartrate transporter